MYAIIELLGKQYKIFENIKIKINKIKIKVNSLILLNKILLFSSKRYFIVDSFFLNKLFFLARVLNHKKEKKINILKFKRRKGHKKHSGFRKKYTEIILENFNLNLFTFFIKNGEKKIRRFYQ